MPELILFRFRRRQRIKTALDKDRFESGFLRLPSDLFIPAAQRLLLDGLKNRIKLWVEPAAREMALLPVFEPASDLDASEHVDKLLDFATTSLQGGDFARYDKFLQTRGIWDKKMREGAEMGASLALIVSNVTGPVKDALMPTAMRIGRVQGVLLSVLRSMDSAIDTFYGEHGTENTRCVLGQVSNAIHHRCRRHFAGCQILF